MKRPKSPPLKPRDKYKSNFERTIAKDLSRLKTGAKYEPLKLPYSVHHYYVPDWVLPNGAIIEGKGKLDSLTRQKMLAVRKTHPELKICFIFMNAFNKIYKGSKTTYADWASKNGFLWSHKYFKLEWLTCTQ